MEKPKSEELSLEQLKKKEKSLKMFIGIFIPLIIVLFFFVIRDYMNGQEMNWAMVTIAICSLAGPADFYPKLKKVQKEMRERS